MKTADLKQAVNFLEQHGIGSGTNITTNLMADMMVQFASQFQTPELSDISMAIDDYVMTKLATEDEIKMFKKSVIKFFEWYRSELRKRQLK